MRTTIAGMDIGFGHAKVCLRTGDKENQTVRFPRIFAEARTNSWGLDNHSVYGIDRDQFYVGAESLSYQDSLIRHDYRDYVKDETYWLCICKALMDLGVLGDNDSVCIERLILGLAPGHYSNGNIGHMKRRAINGIEFTFDGRAYRFSAKDVKILPQGSGAFFATMLTDNGLAKERKGYRKLHGILDVGYRTTDFLVFENGQFIGEREELSEDTGMRTVLEKLQSHVKKKYDSVGIEFLDPVLRGEPFDFRGEAHDLSDLVSKIVSDHIHKRIEPEVWKRWEGRLDRMHRIIICGGGAYLFRHAPDFLR